MQINTDGEFGLVLIVLGNVRASGRGVYDATSKVT